MAGSTEMDDGNPAIEHLDGYLNQVLATNPDGYWEALVTRSLDPNKTPYSGQTELGQEVNKPVSIYVVNKKGSGPLRVNGQALSEILVGGLSFDLLTDPKYSVIACRRGDFDFDQQSLENISFRELPRLVYSPGEVPSPNDLYPRTRVIMARAGYEGFLSHDLSTEAGKRKYGFEMQFPKNIGSVRYEVGDAFGFYFDQGHKPRMGVFLGRDRNWNAGLLDFVIQQHHKKDSLSARPASYIEDLVDKVNAKIRSPLF